MKKQIVILLILFSSLNILAQDSVVVCKYNAWGFYPCVNYNQLNFSDINSGGWMLGRPRNTEVMLGAGITYGNPSSFYVSLDFSKDILTVGETAGAYNNDPTVNVLCYNYRLALNAYYIVIAKKKYGLYVNAGTSFERTILLSENKNTVNPNDTISVFENASFGQNLLLNGGFSFYFYNKKFGFATGLIALKAGYDWAPFKPTSFTWYDYNGNTRTQIYPTISYNGFYAGISFNIWFTDNVVCSFR